MRKIKIPNGYKRLKVGDAIQSGDKFLRWNTWVKSTTVGAVIERDWQQPYIRRIKEVKP